MNFLDLVIIGAGPAGLSAAVYASRYKLNFIVLGKEIGGKINETHKIDNYPGYPSISGFELGMKFKNHAESLGTKIILETAKEVKKLNDGFEITTDKSTYLANNLLFALGSEYRKLSVPGEEEFKGKGVSYCATCDGPFFRNKKVAVIGGGNSAASAAILLGEYALEVILFYRGDELKCEPGYYDQLKNNPKIKIACCYDVKKINGNGVVKSLVLSQPYEGQEEVPFDGVFIEIGSDPSVELILPLGINLNEKHFIITNPDQSTNVNGIFAAGDLTTNSNGFRQIITAASEGAVAALSIYERVKKTKQK